MNKNRLRELQENAEKYGDEIDLSIINHFAATDMEEPLLNEFFNEVYELRCLINKLSSLVVDIVSFQPQLIDKTKEKLEEKSKEIKLLGHCIRMKLKQIKTNYEKLPSAQVNNVKQRIIDAQIDDITKHFCTIMNKYYQSVVIYREIHTERVQRQYYLVKTDDDEIDPMLDNEHCNMYPEIIMNLPEAKQKLHQMELRHQQLIDLENKTRQILEITSDINYLIEYHSNEITYIDHKISQAIKDLKKAVPVIVPKKVPRCLPLSVNIIILIII